MAKSKTRTTKANTTAKRKKVKIVDQALDDLTTKVAAADQGAKASIPIQLDTLSSKEDLQQQLSLFFPESTAALSLPPTSTNITSNHEKSHASTDDHNHYLRRFIQYSARCERRRERVKAARLKLVYEKDILKSEERWRTDALTTVYVEIEEASRVIAESTVNSTAQASFEKLQAAMARVTADEENIRKQERAVSKHEEAVSKAEDSLDRVLNSMFTAARKCLEHSGMQRSDSDSDLISSSTQVSTAHKPSRPKPTLPPTSVTKFFEKKADEAIMFERLMELEFERKEELDRRELERDRGELPDEEAMQSADENWTREHKLATRDYEYAHRELQDAKQQCELEGLNPDDFRNTGSDDDDDDDDDEELEDATTAQKTLQKTASDTFSHLTSILRRLETVGPDPDDPTGMINTTLESDIAGSLPDARATEKPAKRIVTWMADVEEIQPARVYKDDTPTSIDDSKLASNEYIPRSTPRNHSPHPDDSASQPDIHAGASEVAHAGSQSEINVEQEDCMDDRMLMNDSRQSVADVAGEGQPDNDGSVQEHIMNVGSQFEKQPSAVDEPLPAANTLEELEYKRGEYKQAADVTSAVRPLEDDSKTTRASFKPHFRVIVKEIIALLRLKEPLRRTQPAQKSAPEQVAPHSATNQDPKHSGAGQEALQSAAKHNPEQSALQHDTMEPDAEAVVAQSVPPQEPARLATTEVIEKPRKGGTSTEFDIW